MTPPKLKGWYVSKWMYQQSKNVPTRSENQKKKMTRSPYRKL